MATNQEFNGIIMYRRDYKERDLLVKILTDQIGKTMFMVKDAKKRGSRIGPAVLPNTHGRYVGTLNQTGMSFINAVLDAEQYFNIAQDIFKNAYATYILALLDSAYQDNQPLGHWFDTISNALTLIDEGDDEQIIANIVEVQLLAAFGVQPEWRYCAICGRDDLPFDYSMKYNGLICQQHFQMDEHRLHVDQKTIFLLRRFSVIKMEQINHVNVSEETKKHLRTVIDQIYDESVGLKLKSKKFIDEMGSWSDKLTLKPRTDIDKNE